MSRNEPASQFNEDYFDNLRQENELQRLFLQAEMGAVFCGDNNIPPDIESLFLRKVREFEQEREKSIEVSIYELIGQPSFRLCDQLTDMEIKKELKGLLNLMKERNVELTMQGNYGDREIYRFITEEFFHQLTENIQMPGLVRCFSYEEFHPNHDFEIRERTRDFISAWFDRKFDNMGWVLSDDIIPYEGTVMPRYQLMEKIGQVFSAYPSFSNQQYIISEVKFEWNEEFNNGLANSRGTISYDAVSENGQRFRIEGEFVFYLTNQFGYWEIYSFVFPGLPWEE